MKYKILWIIGSEKSYRRRVYIISKQELDRLKDFNTFVLRETTSGEKVYRSCEADKHYMIIE